MFSQFRKKASGNIRRLAGRGGRAQLPPSSASDVPKYTHTGQGASTEINKPSHSSGTGNDTGLSGGASQRPELQHGTGSSKDKNETTNSIHASASHIKDPRPGSNSNPPPPPPTQPVLIETGTPHASNVIVVQLPTPLRFNALSEANACLGKCDKPKVSWNFGDRHFMADIDKVEFDDVVAMMELRGWRDYFVLYNTGKTDGGVAMETETDEFERRVREMGGSGDKGTGFDREDEKAGSGSVEGPTGSSQEAGSDDKIESTSGQNSSDSNHGGNTCHMAGGLDQIYPASGGRHTSISLNLQP